MSKSKTTNPKPREERDALEVDRLRQQMDEAADLWDIARKAAISTGATSETAVFAIAVLEECQPRTWEAPDNALARISAGVAVSRASENPGFALYLAGLALRVADGPGPLAFAWAARGNAFRVLAETGACDEAFVRSERYLRRAGGSLRDRGHVLERGQALSLLASWAIDRRDFASALRRLDEALELAIGADHRDEVAKLHVKKSRALGEAGNAHGALLALAAARSWIPEGDPLAFCAIFNAGWLAVELARDGELEPQAAREKLERARELARGPVDRLRCQWLEGRILAAEGKQAEALAALGSAWGELLQAGRVADAAICALDAAELHAARGEALAVRQLAAALGPIFKSKALGREALAALGMLLSSLHAEAGAAAVPRLLAEVGRFVHLAQENPRATFG